MVFSFSFFPESFAIIPGNNERYVQTGSSLRLQCKISKTINPGESPPVIKWFRNDTNINPGDNNYGRTRVVTSPVQYKKVRNIGLTNMFPRPTIPVRVSRSSNGSGMTPSSTQETMSMYGQGLSLCLSSIKW